MERLIPALARAAGLAPETIRGEVLPPSGEGLQLVRLRLGTDGAACFAKKLDSRLRREAAAYRGPLRGAAIAPALLHHLRDDAGGEWIVLEDGGTPLDRAFAEREPAALAALAARIHGAAGRLRPRLLAPRAAHVHHDRRHLAGEWRIARERLEAGARAGVIPRGDVPSDAEARAVLDAGWRALRSVGATLIHGDLQPGNILRDAAGQLRAVDWSRWGRGSPLIDLVSLGFDLPAGARARLLDAYLERRRPRERTSVWREGLERAIPLRQLLGLGVLADHARRGDPAGFVRRDLARRREGWNAVRREAAAWT